MEPVRSPGARECPSRRATTTSSPTRSMHDHVGDVWYQTVARVPERWRGERIVLRFDAATHSAVVWVDETQVVEHEGGYTPFEADITDVVEPGAEDRITAVVDNASPGRRSPRATSRRRPTGRASTVLPRLLQLRRAAPDGLALHDTALVHRGHDRRHRARRLDRNGRATRSRRPATSRRDRRRRSATLRASRSRERPAHRRAQRRGRPSMAAGRGLPLRADGRARGDGETPVDAYSLPVGIRTVRVDGARFLINDEPFYFTRLRQARGQRRPRQGPRRRVHGARLRADGLARRELVPHVPLPVRGGGARVRRPARHRRHRRDARGRDQQRPRRRRLRRASRSRPSRADTINAATQEAHRQAIRELIARDKNHPCVVIWSIANEPESVTPESRAYFEPLVAETRRLDPTRPVGVRQRHGRDARPST